MLVIENKIKFFFYFHRKYMTYMWYNDDFNKIVNETFRD